MTVKIFVQNLSKIVLIIVCLLTINTAAAAQRKRTKTKKPAPPTATVNNTAIKDGASKVGIQIKNLTKFIYLLGSVANGIQDIDNLARENKASREVQAKNEQFKSDVIASIRSLRAGLVDMEVDFRVKPELKPYLPLIEGIIGMSANAEDLALAGRFTDSGKELLLIVEKLTDVLVEMP